jgi:hypothetical protein
VSVRMGIRDRDRWIQGEIRVPECGRAKDSRRQPVDFAQEPTVREPEDMPVVSDGSGDNRGTVCVGTPFQTGATAE